MINDPTTTDFDPYAYMARVQCGRVDENSVHLTDQYRATDLGVMLKSALRAIELLSARVAELEKNATPKWR